MCMAVAARGFNLLCVAQTLTISPDRLKDRPYPTCGQSCMSRARMAELVDAPASGAGAGNGVEVRVLFRAPVFHERFTRRRRWRRVSIALCNRACMRRSIG